MTKTNLGIKRACESCGARFYDLDRDPPTCPKCATEAGAGRSRIKAGAGAEPEDLTEVALEEEAKADDIAVQEDEALIEDVRDISMDTGDQVVDPNGDGGAVEKKD